MAEGKYTVDSSDWPTVLITYEGSVSDAAFTVYLAELEATLLRQEPHGAVLDARAGIVPPVLQRQRKAAWLRAHAAQLAQYNVGTAFVIDSSLLRGALSALMWMAQPAFPYAVVGSVQEGRAWVAATLATSVLGAKPAGHV